MPDIAHVWLFSISPRACEIISTVNDRDTGKPAFIDDHVAADELIAAFSQSSELIQANPTATAFYSGKCSKQTKGHAGARHGLRPETGAPLLRATVDFQLSRGGDILEHPLDQRSS